MAKLTEVGREGSVTQGPPCPSSTPHKRQLHRTHSSVRESVTARSPTGHSDYTLFALTVPTRGNCWPLLTTSGGSLRTAFNLVRQPSSGEGGI